jgi:hypothetical protein
MRFNISTESNHSYMPCFAMASNKHASGCTVCHVFSYGSKNGLEKARRFPEFLGWKSTQQEVTEVGIVCVSNFL